MGNNLELSKKDIEDIMRGVHVKVKVDPDVFGVDRVLILGLFTGSAEIVDKLLKATEQKSSEQASLIYIRKLQKKSKKKDVKGKSKLPDNTKKGIVTNPTVANDTEETMREYLREQQGLDE